MAQSWTLNRHACESLGYTRQELIGDETCGLRRRSTTQTGLRRVVEQVEAGDALTFETQWRRQDGTVFPVEVRGRQFRRGAHWLGISISRDVSERKRAEAELRSQQEMLDLAQTAARAVAFDWYVGARENENHWSPDLEVMYGLEPGTFDRTYQGWKKLVHPDDWPSVKLAIQHAHASGDVVAEYRVIHKDGTVHWLQAKGCMFFDAEGRPDRMVGFMIDVTDRRQAEEELRASEVRFRTFVDHATDAFFLIDDQFSIMDVNRPACERLGQSRDELIGMHSRDFDVGLDEPSIARLAQRAGAGEIMNFETRHRRKDGSAFPVEIRTGTFRQGGALFYLALARDISERKLAEESRRQAKRTPTDSRNRPSRTGSMGIRRGMQSASSTTSEDQRPHLRNRSGIREKPTREIIGQSVTILTPVDRRSWNARHSGAHTLAASGWTTTETSTEPFRPDGTLVRTYSREPCHPVIEGRGRRRRRIARLRDRHQRTQARRGEGLREKDDALQMARTELAHVSRLTTLCSSTTSIAHEVSQPLGAMVASAWGMRPLAGSGPARDGGSALGARQHRRRRQAGARSHRADPGADEAAGGAHGTARY